MAFSGMTLGLNGQTPVAAKAAFMVSGVNARKNARPNTPAKSLFVTLLKCKSSNAWISRRNSNFIFAKQTTSSPCKTWVQ